MSPRADVPRAVNIAAARELQLTDQHDAPRRLGDWRGQNVVLYFYPKDDTPGCTVEGKEFRELHDQFNALDCVIVGVSTDSVESHRAFADKHGFPFTLLADQGGALAQAWGVLDGRMAQRATFVLGRDGAVARVFHDVTPRGHAQRVLNFVRTLLESHRMLGG